MDKHKIEEVCRKIGTPSYVFDVDEFATRSELVKRTFGEKIGLCYSIKANPFLVGRLPECIEKLEVCSPGELSICENVLGVDFSKIVFSGVNKTATDIARAMDDGVEIFTIESNLHANLINECAMKKRIKVKALIRVASNSQFGMDEEDALALVRRRETEGGGYDIVGLHYFTGTQKRDVAVISKELDYIARFADRIRSETGLEIRQIEYGTGLAVDYFKENAEKLEEERLQAVNPKVREIAERYDLTVEMGRFFAACCGYYFTRVVDIKTNCGINYAICDGGLNHLKYDGQIKGMQIPKIIHIQGKPGGDSGNGQNGAAKWTICGSLCTTADVLCRDVKLNHLRIGDVLVFCDTGAYSVTEGMAVFLSREMPSVSLYSKKDGLRTVRKMMPTYSFNTPLVMS